jgi:hypothetical protein
MAGYSQTPLVKKLGIKEGFKMAIIGARQDFESALVPMPENVSINTRGRCA